jgi:hypothetical protein
MLRRLSADQQRNIRHWVMEFVVVVAGVLLALWLQQWSERRRALLDLAATEDAVHDEVRESLKNLIWREAISQCHIDRAARLKDMLLTSDNQWPGLNENTLTENSISQATGVQTVIQGVYQRPFEPFPRAAWESALTTGALAPMDRHRFAKLTAIYAQLQFFAENQERENRAATTLSALALPQELTPAVRTMMLGALYEVDTSRFMFLYQGASVLADEMKELGWNDKAEIDRSIAEDQAADRKRAAKWRPCVKPERNPFAE